MKIFFMHIPKTAGTSLRRFLERSMGERGFDVRRLARDGIWSDESESYAPYEEFVRADRQDLRTADLICGHYPYHVLSLLPEETQVVVLLRNPFDRCISHIKYQMAYERQTEPDRPELASNVNDFIAMPRNEMFLQTLANLAVKYLSFEGRPDAPVSQEKPSLEVALARCRKTHFGFADELAAFQRRLDAMLFRQHAEGNVVRFDNASQDRFSRADLTVANANHLRSLNSLDIRLDEQMRRLLTFEPGSA